jgi:hypothetical protein
MRSYGIVAKEKDEQRAAEIVATPPEKLGPANVHRLPSLFRAKILRFRLAVTLAVIEVRQTCQTARSR